MRHITTIEEMRAARAKLPGTVAFVPTMGFLHDGHLALMRQGLESCDHLVVSVFVNPTQFGPGEDLHDYPRDIEGDAEKCRSLGCDLFFTPRRDDIYVDGDCTRVVVEDLDEHLCGASRPVHFPGVTNVVNRLFNIITPDVAVFGEKDYQQLAIIRRMVHDLHLPIEILGVPTVREDDGLAMSSRNRYLDPEQRQQARALSQGLIAAHRLYNESNNIRAGDIVAAATAPVENQRDARIDYIDCVNPHTLVPFEPDELIGGKGAVVAMAVFIGEARLIDNLRLDRPVPQGPLRSL